MDKLRSQNNQYVNEYCKRAAMEGITANNPAIILLRTICHVVNKKEYYPGSLRAAGEDQKTRGRLAGFGIVPEPGIGIATWCTYAAWEILTTMGYDVLPILDTEYHSIHYTTAREMYVNAKASPDQVTEIDWKTAVLKANGGIPVLIAALGRGANQCHVGIMAPIFIDVGKVRVIDCMVGQAGFYNGFGTIGDFFSKSYVGEPAFFELRKKV
jgi:hypothetical protein